MKQVLRSLGLGAFALSLAIAGSNPAFAGFILAGTDSDDHGFANISGNQDGWLFMQRALENLAPGVTNGNKVVTVLGSSSTALTAASSAFNLSTLAGAGGWTLQTVTTANLATFFGGGISNSGILMMDSGTNVSGGVDGSAFVPYAATINTFVGNGGGLLSQGNGYDWVTTLLPALSVTDVGGGGISTAISLTAAGNAAFPGLTNQDLSTGPWHNYFTNTGVLPILGTSQDNTGATRALILGSSGGSITNPTNPAVPEPASLLLLGTGLAALVGFRRMKKA